jgi:hypothetical protein
MCHGSLLLLLPEAELHLAAGGVAVEQLVVEQRRRTWSLSSGTSTTAR